MSEAEQSREPQRDEVERDEVERAGFVGKDEDSVMADAASTGEAPEGVAASDRSEAEASSEGKAVTAAQTADPAPADVDADADAEGASAEPEDAVAGAPASTGGKASGPATSTSGTDAAPATSDTDTDTDTDTETETETEDGAADRGAAGAVASDRPAADAPVDKAERRSGAGDAVAVDAGSAGSGSAGASAESNGAGASGPVARDAGASAAADSTGDKAKDEAADGRGRPAGSGGAGSAPAAPRSAGKGTAEGRLLARRYRLGGVLGRGGMGTVWRAVDETLGRTVAVKELRFPNAIDEEEKRRLITRTLREAKAIARIRNNNAVTVYDVVEEDDRPWIVMELVEGKSLAEVVREDGTLTPRRAAEVGLAILDVLRSAHREGILHRDVKPSNVLIGKDGRVVLTDFGIAQVEGDPSITSTGMLVGAPSYISPERARGHKPGPAADLWSLGGLLYASVEGCPPYDKGSAIATLTAVMTEPLDPPKNAGPLEEVIYGLLAKDPAQRLDDAGARALLTHVVNAPEAPVRPAAAETPAERTRAIRIPPVPPVPEARPEAKPKDPAADRVRGALRSVRKAAAAAKVESKAESSSLPGAEAAQSTAVSGMRPAPVRAPLTDVVPRRTLVIIAVVLVLAVLSTILVFAFGGDDEKGNQGKTKDDKIASTGATAGAGDGKTDGGTGGENPDSGEDTGKGKGEGTDDGTDAGNDGGSDGATGGQPGGGGEGDGAALPDGYVMVTNDQFHFSMAMPKGFRLTGIAGQNSGAKFSVDGGTPRVQVDFNARPKDDAAAAWAAAVPGVSATSNGYKHLGIRKVDYNGYPTVADWEFERNENGQRVRILNRGFKVDAKRGYSIMITCKASEWDASECETLRRTAFATFSPKD